MPDLPLALAALPGALSQDLELEDANMFRDLRQAAVLILLYPHEDAISLLLTRRPHTLSTHAGQISLPGGAREAEDLNLWQTALREVREELGIETCGLTRIGRLPDVPVLVSNYVIAPFVAWSRHAPEPRPDPVEVSEILEVRLEELLDPNAICEEPWELREGTWLVTYFRVREDAVWGATARILSLFCRYLSDAFSRVVDAPGSIRPLSPS
jgi:8-oxo-dGTP pyrophosphatase MutT (NUDIX family)